MLLHIDGAHEIIEGILSAKLPLDARPYLIALYCVLIAASLLCAVLSFFRWQWCGRQIKHYGLWCGAWQLFFLNSRKRISGILFWVGIVNAWMLFQGMLIIVEAHHHAGPAFHVWLILSRAFATFFYALAIRWLFRIPPPIAFEISSGGYFRNDWHYS